MPFILLFSRQTWEPQLFPKSYFLNWKDVAIAIRSIIGFNSKWTFIVLKTLHLRSNRPIITWLFFWKCGVDGLSVISYILSKYGLLCCSYSTHTIKIFIKRVDSYLKFSHSLCKLSCQCILVIHSCLTLFFFSIFSILSLL